MPNPKIRFKKDDGTNYPDWEKRRISEIGTVVTGNTPSTKKEEYYGGNIIWVTPSDISDNPVITDTERKLTQEGFAKSRKLPRGSVLITCIASIGKNCIIGTEGSCNQQINAIIPNNDMVSYYILSAINHMHASLSKLGGNGSMKIVNKKSFETILVAVPSTEEQKKIAALFSELDNLISFMSDEISNLEKFKKAMMQKIFSQEIRFKKDDGTDYAEWEKIKLGGLIKQHKIRNKNRLPLEIYSVNNEVGFLPQSKQFLDAGYLNCTNTSTYMIVPQNYFAYNPARINIGSIGYQNVGYDVQVSSLYVVFSTMDRLDDGYLWYWFNTKYFKKAVRHFQEGSVRFCYGYDKLEKTEICFPIDLEEQKKIADLFSAIDDAIIAAKKELEGYKNLKKYLLKQMFA